MPSIGNAHALQDAKVRLTIISNAHHHLILRCQFCCRRHLAPLSCACTKHEEERPEHDATILFCSDAFFAAFRPPPTYFASFHNLFLSRPSITRISLLHASTNEMRLIPPPAELRQPHAAYKSIRAFIDVRGTPSAGHLIRASKGGGPPPPFSFRHLRGSRRQEVLP